MMGIFAPDRALGRAFRDTSARLAFAIPLVLFAIYAAVSSTGLYYLRILVASDHAEEIQVWYDSGAGFSGENSVQAHVPASAGLEEVDVPILTDRIRAISFSPVNGRVVMQVGGVAVRLNVKMLARPRLIRSFDLDALDIQPRVIESLPGGTRGLRMEALDGAAPPGCNVTLREPLKIGFSWYYFSYRCLAFAGLWLLAWWALAALCRRRWGSWRPAPAAAIWMVAAGSAVLSCYPVVFLGKSFVSVNFKDGPALLYDDPSTLPDTHNPELDGTAGADIFALTNAFGPYAAVEHRALLQDGELPLWNRYDEAGLTLLGQGQSMFGDPLHFLVILAGGQAWAWDVKFVLAKCAFAAGVGFLVCATTECLPVALLLCFSASFIGFFAFRLNHPAYFSVCYAPWILLTWTRLVRAKDSRQSLRWAGGLILANWMELNSGTAKEAYMLLASLNATGLLLLLISRLPRQEKMRRLLGATAAGAIFLLLAAPVLVAFFDTLGKSGSSYTNPVMYQLQPALGIGLFDDIFYRQFSGGEGVLDPSLNGLVLLGVLVAVGGARRLWRDRAFVAVCLSTLPPLALVFGVVPLALIRHLPFLRNIYHVDNTFSCVLMIQCFVLAGFGLKHCVTREDRAVRGDLCVGLVAGCALLCLYFGAIGAQQRTGVLFEPARRIEFSPFFCWYVPSLVIAIIALPFVLRQMWRAGRSPALITFLLVCLLLLHWRMGIAVRSRASAYTPVLPDRVDLFARSPAIERLRADQAEPFRAFGIGNVFTWGYGAMAGVESIIGLDALWNPLVNDLNDAATRVAGAAFIDAFTDPDHPNALAAAKPFHDLLGVRYYLTMPGRPLPPLPGMSLPANLDLDVYRNDRAWPRAFFVDRLGSYASPDDFAAQVVAGDGRPFAAIDQQERALAPQAARFAPAQAGRQVVPASHYRLTNHRTAFDVQVPAAGVIVLMEPYMEADIVASLNGQPAPVWRVDQAFRGVPIDRPGLYHVVVAYRPRGFTVALWAFGLGIVLSTAAAWRLWFTKPTHV